MTTWGSDENDSSDITIKKDVKRMKKRGKKFEEFKEVIREIAAEEKLEAKYRDHVLVGQY